MGVKLYFNNKLINPDVDEVTAQKLKEWSETVTDDGIVNTFKEVINWIAQFDKNNAYEGDGFEDFYEDNVDDSDSLSYSYIQSLPNYSTEPDDAKYKLGYIQLNSYPEKSDVYTEAYRRFYNAYKNNGTCAHYIMYIHGSNSYSYSRSTSIKTISSYPDDTFPSLGVYLADLSLTSNEVDWILNLVQKDYQELMWRWGYENQITNSLTSSSDGIVTFKWLPYYDENTRQSMINKCNNTFKKICNTVKKAYGINFIDQSYALNNKAYTVEEKVRIGKVIHDYLVSHNNYGDASTTGAYEGNQIMWSALCEGEFDPVCAGYAAAFYYCCWKWGITCLIVNGTSQEQNHAWNMVTYEPVTFIDENSSEASIWQDVDCTWDDPTLSNGILSWYCSWTYFNKTTAFFNESHVRKVYSDNVNGVYISYPAEGTCNSYEYAYSDVTGEGLLYTGF